MVSVVKVEGIRTFDKLAREKNENDDSLRGRLKEERIKIMKEILNEN